MGKCDVHVNPMGQGAGKTMGLYHVHEIHVSDIYKHKLDTRPMHPDCGPAVHNSLFARLAMNQRGNELAAFSRRRSQG